MLYSVFVNVELLLGLSEVSIGLFGVTLGLEGGSTLGWLGTILWLLVLLFGSLETFIALLGLIDSVLLLGGSLSDCDVFFWVNDS